VSDERTPEMPQQATVNLRMWAVEQAVEFVKRKDGVENPAFITTVANRLYVYVTTGKTYS